MRMRLCLHTSAFMDCRRSTKPCICSTCYENHRLPRNRARRSGSALYRGGVLTSDWRKGDVFRLLLKGRIHLFVVSRPPDAYPQELMLRFPVSMISESRS